MVSYKDAKDSIIICCYVAIIFFLIMFVVLPNPTIENNVEPTLLWTLSSVVYTIFCGTTYPNAEQVFPTLFGLSPHAIMIWAVVIVSEIRKYRSKQT